MERNEEEVKKELTEWLGFEPPRVCGIRIIIALFIPNNAINSSGDVTNIVLSDSSKDLESHLSVSGRVIAVGPDAYIGKCFDNSGAYCKLGDYVAFDGREGTRLKYRGVPIRIVEDHKCLLPLEDPSYVTRN